MNTEEYRNYLIQSAQKSQDGYDKTIISLSSGAIALSVLFLERITGDNPPKLVVALILSWIAWTFAISSILASFHFSRKAMHKAIEQTDKNDFSEGVGGKNSGYTSKFNAGSGLFFFLGVIFLLYFLV